jgi:hypothetical protein
LERDGVRFERLLLFVRADDLVPVDFLADALRPKDLDPELADDFFEADLVVLVPGFGLAADPVFFPGDRRAVSNAMATACFCGLP